MFGKKKNNGKVTLMHYEGLQGFRQDFPCKLDVDDSAIIFCKIVSSILCKHL